MSKKGPDNEKGSKKTPLPVDFDDPVESPLPLPVEEGHEEYQQKVVRKQGKNIKKEPSIVPKPIDNPLYKKFSNQDLEIVGGILELMDKASVPLSFVEAANLYIRAQKRLIQEKPGTQVHPPAPEVLKAVETVAKSVMNALDKFSIMYDERVKKVVEGNERKKLIDEFRQGLKNINASINKVESPLPLSFDEESDQVDVVHKTAVHTVAYAVPEAEEELEIEEHLEEMHSTTEPQKSKEPRVELPWGSIRETSATKKLKELIERNNPKIKSQPESEPESHSKPKPKGGS